MKRSELQRVDEIIGLWISFTEKSKSIDDIARSGPTVETKLIEFLGDFPQLSDIKPDVLSAKVDKIRKFYISKEERRADILISAFPDKFRRVLTEYYLRKGKNNPATNTKWTHNDVALLLKLKPERYKLIRAYLLQLLIEVDKSSFLDASIASLNKSLKAIG